MAGRAASQKPSTQLKYYPFNGGIDIVTPALSVDPGFALAMVNYEPWFNGGYRRIDGYERFDGHAKPSAALSYVLIIPNGTTGLPFTAIGTSIGTATGLGGTGVSSSATAQFVEGIVTGGTTYLALTNIVGTFTTGEKLVIGTSTSTGVTTALPSLTYAPPGTGLSGYTYLSEFLAQSQNYYRQQIKAVPGVGNPIGVWQNGTNIYAIRGTNTSGTSTSALPAVLYVSSSTGWVVGGTYCTTIFYNGLNTQVFSGTANVTTNGVMYVTAVATGSVTVGMTMSDTTGYIPSNGANSLALNNALGAQVIAQIGGAGVGGTGTYQLSLNPTMTVPSENVYGIQLTNLVPAVGSAITGASGTGTLYQQVPHDTTIGYLALTNVTGTFTAGENLKSGGTTFCAAVGTSTAFTLPPGGFYRWKNANFFATSSTYSTYGVNGKGPAFQIDQNNVIMPILFPQIAQPNQPTANNPFLVENYQNCLVLGLPGGIYQTSVPGQPTQFNAFLGAAEFSTGAELTNMYAMVGGPTLAMTTTRNTQSLTGTPANTSTLAQAIMAEKAGAILYAAQLLDTIYALNNLGITSLSRTQSYGNFVGSTVSQLVMPMVQALRPYFADSTIVRGSNEARFYFTDGSCLIMYVPGLGQQNKAWSAIESGVTAQFGYASYPAPVFNIVNTEDQNNNETSYFTSTDGTGFIYQDRSGASFDGAAVTSYVRLAFNNVGSPGIRKYFRRADLELNSPTQIALKFAWDLSYSNSESSSSVSFLNANNIPVVNVFGGGGYWDSIYWNQFDWDGQTISTARASLNGTGENISFLIFHQAITDSPFILQGLVLHFDPRRPQR